MLSLLRSIILVVAVLIAGAPQALAETLYGVTFDGLLITVDTATGAGTIVASFGCCTSDIGVRSGVLYVYDQPTNLVKGITREGTVLNAINIGTKIAGEGGFAFRSDGMGFINSDAGGPLYIFDLTIPAAAVVTSSFALVDGLAFGPSGILYGTGSARVLYTVDQSTGVTTTIGPLGIAAISGVGGLAFGADGTLFGAINDNLYTIDVTNGSAKLVGPIGFGLVSGIVSISPPTLQVAIGGLIHDVEVLLETGILTGGQANGLIDKLTAAITSLNLGNRRSTCGQMKAFVNQVNAFMNSGTLSPAQGQALLRIAEAVRAQIGCA